MALGGGGGTSIAARAFQALPLGVPKIIVSTMASGDTRAYVGETDLILIPSVVDIAGVNRISARVMSNAAAAMAGWLGRQDSNLGMAVPKTAALPLGDAPTRAFLHALPMARNQRPGPSSVLEQAGPRSIKRAVAAGRAGPSRCPERRGRHLSEYSAAW
jgi:hypothetical protein